MAVEVGDFELLRARKLFHLQILYQFSRFDLLAVREILVVRGLVTELVRVFETALRAILELLPQVVEFELLLFQAGFQVRDDRFVLFLLYLQVIFESALLEEDLRFEFVEFAQLVAKLLNFLDVFAVSLRDEGQRVTEELPEVLEFVLVVSDDFFHGKFNRFYFLVSFRVAVILLRAQGKLAPSRCLQSQQLARKSEFPLHEFDSFPRLVVCLDKLVPDVVYA